jgi:histidine triad (HIT) family protein
LSPDEMGKIHAMIAKVDRAERKLFGSTGYILLQKNGAEAGQTVPHVHFHYYQMSPKDSKLWLAIRLFTAYWFKPLGAEEIEKQKLELLNKNS